MLETQRKYKLAVYLSILVLILAVIFYFSNKDKQTTTFSSIQEAMNTGERLDCSYKSGGLFSKASAVQVGDKRFRSVVTADKVKNYVVFDGVVYYVWKDNDKNGQRFTRACVTEGGKNVENPEQPFENATRIDCREGGEVDLVIPADVTFADPCTMTMQSVEIEQYREIEKRLSPPNQPVTP